MRDWGWVAGLGALAWVAGGAMTARAQTTALNGVGDGLPQAEIAQEFQAYSAANPSVVFNYQLSSTATTIFLSDTSLQFGTDETPLTSAQALGYTRTATNGPLIQIPMFGFGVAVPYNNPSLGRRQQLTDAQLCGIMSGTITNWSQISNTSGAITVVYRADQDPTSFLLSQHFNAVCNAGNSGFGIYPVPITTQFSAMFAGGVVPKNFVAENGAANAATEILATTYAMGYLTPDYTSVAPHSPHTTALKVAGLVNGVNGTAYAPTATAISVGLANPGLGSTNTSPPATESAAKNVLSWVPTIPVTNKGYPIVGYGDWLLVTCNNNTTVDQQLENFLVDHYKISTYVDIRKNSNLVNIPQAFYSAIHAVFLTNQRKYNLNIGNPKVCPHG